MRTSPKSQAPTTPGAATKRLVKYADVPGFCKSTKLDEIQKHGYVLTPGRYVGAEAVEDDGEPFEEKMARLAGRSERSRPKRPASMPLLPPTSRSLGMASSPVYAPEKASVSTVKDDLTVELVRNPYKFGNRPPKATGKNYLPVGMRYWTAKLDDFIRLSDREILANAGKISHALAEEYAHSQFAQYEEQRRQIEVSSPSATSSSPSSRSSNWAQPSRSAFVKGRKNDERTQA